MVCGLGTDQLAMLKYLVEHRCVGPDKAKRLEAIERDLEPKGIDVRRVLGSLLGSYVGKTPKQSKWHYYVNPGKTLAALAAHGFWSPGRIHRLL